MKTSVGHRGKVFFITAIVTAITVSSASFGQTDDRVDKDKYLNILNEKKAASDQARAEAQRLQNLWQEQLRQRKNLESELSNLKTSIRNNEDSLEQHRRAKREQESNIANWDIDLEQTDKRLLELKRQFKELEQRFIRKDKDVKAQADLFGKAEQRNQSAERKLAQDQADLARIKRDLAAMTTRCDELKNRIDQLTRERNQLIRSLDLNVDGVNGPGDLVNLVADELQSATSRLTDLGQENADADQRKANASADKATTDADVKSLKNKADDLAEKAKETKKTITETQKALAQNKAANEQAGADMTATSAEINNLDGILTNLEKELKQVEARELKQARDDKTAADEQMELAKEAKAEAKKELDEAEGADDPDEEAIKKAKKKLERAEKQFTFAEKQCERANQALANAEKRVAALQEQIDVIPQKKQQLETKRDQLQKKKHQLAKEKLELTRAMSRAEIALSDFEQRCTDALDELADAEAKQAKAIIALQRAVKESERKTRAFNGQQKKVDALTAGLRTMRRLATDFKRTQKDFDDAFAQVQGLEKALAECKRIVAQSQAEANKTRDLAAQAKVRLDELKGQRQTLQQQCDDVAQDQRQTTTRFQNISQDIKNEKAALARSKQNISQTELTIKNQRSRETSLEGPGGAIAVALADEKRRRATFDDRDEDASEKERITEAAKRQFEKIKVQYDQELAANIDLARKDAGPLGQKEGVVRGQEDGSRMGEQQGRTTGAALGEGHGRKRDFSEAFTAARARGQSDAKSDGFEQGQAEAFGKLLGYQQGFEDEYIEANRAKGQADGEVNGLFRAVEDAKEKGGAAANAERARQWAKTLAKQTYANSDDINVTAGGRQSNVDDDDNVRPTFKLLSDHHDPRGIFFDIPSGGPEKPGPQVIPGLNRLGLDRLDEDGDIQPQRVPDADFRNRNQAPARSFAHPDFKKRYQQVFNEHYARVYRQTYSNNNLNDGMKSYPEAYRAAFDTAKKKSFSQLSSRTYADAVKAGDEQGFATGYHETYSEKYKTEYTKVMQAFMGDIKKGKAILVNLPNDEIRDKQPDHFAKGLKAGRSHGEKAGMLLAYKEGYQQGDKQAYDDNIDQEIAKAEAAGVDGVKEEFANNYMLKGLAAVLRSGDDDDQDRLGQGSSASLGIGIGNYGQVDAPMGAASIQINATSGIQFKDKVVRLNAVPAETKAGITDVASGFVVAGQRVRTENGQLVEKPSAINLTVEVTDSKTRQVIGRFPVTKKIRVHYKSYQMTQPDLKTKGLTTWASRTGWPVVDVRGQKHNRVCLANFSADKSAEVEYRVSTKDTRLETKNQWQPMHSLQGRTDGSRSWFTCMPYQVRAKRSGAASFKAVMHVQIRDKRSKKIFWDGEHAVDAKISH